MNERRLIFVYNADSGLLNALKDAVHKVARPESYPCSLCATTYGAVSMRREWRNFVERLPYPAIFLHRDEWRREFPDLGEPLPAIFLAEEGTAPRTLVGASDMPLGTELSDLMATLGARLADQP